VRRQTAGRFADELRTSAESRIAYHPRVSRWFPAPIPRADVGSSPVLRCAHSSTGQLINSSTRQVINMNSHDVNRRTWDRLATTGSQFAKVATDEECAQPLLALDRRGWLPGSV